MSTDAKRMNEIRSSVALEGVKPLPYKGKSAPFTAWDVTLAVNDIYDMCEKCQLNFIALDDLAKAIRDKNDQLMTDHLEVAMHARNLTPEIKSLFKTWNFEETKYGYKYYFSPPTKWDIKIPVEIHVIRKNYKFLSNPDQGWFGVNDFYLPNPFETYWKARRFV